MQPTGAPADTLQAQPAQPVPSRCTCSHRWPEYTSAANAKKREQGLLSKCLAVPHSHVGAPANY